MLNEKCLPTVMHLQHNIHLKQQKHNIFYCNIETLAVLCRGKNIMSVSYWGSCRFHTQCPHCESSKYISAHLRTHGGDGPKVTYWQVQCWRIAILRQEETPRENIRNQNGKRRYGPQWLFPGDGGRNLIGTAETSQQKKKNLLMKKAAKGPKRHQSRVIETEVKQGQTDSSVAVSPGWCFSP